MSDKNWEAERDRMAEVIRESAIKIRRDAPYINQGDAFLAGVAAGREQLLRSLGPVREALVIAAEASRYRATHGIITNALALLDELGVKP